MACRSAGVAYPRTRPACPPARTRSRASIFRTRACRVFLSARRFRPASRCWSSLVRVIAPAHRDDDSAVSAFFRRARDPARPFASSRPSAHRAARSRPASDPRCVPTAHSTASSCRPACTAHTGRPAPPTPAGRRTWRSRPAVRSWQDTRAYKPAPPGGQRSAGGAGTPGSAGQPSAPGRAVRPPGTSGTRSSRGGPARAPTLRQVHSTSLLSRTCIHYPKHAKWVNCSHPITGALRLRRGWRVTCARSAGRRAGRPGSHSPPATASARGSSWKPGHPY